MEFFPATSAAPKAVSTINDEAEACAAVLFACLRANELDSEAENAVFQTAIQSRNIFLGRDANQLITAAAAHLEQYGNGATLIDAAIGAIREQTKLPLFFHCLDVILSDGLVTPQEHKIFLYLKKQF
ncbi:MAG: hypothetical protein JNJ57_13860, partial [Saprospiraceae bacterium]|nr:hypothetical protein [Saprospiraceae bacterium]